MKNTPPSVRSELSNLPENPDQHRPRRSGWTPERRAAAAARIRETRPWLRSTGPKTAAGKARCAQNALKHGRYSAAARAARWRERAKRGRWQLLAAHYRLANKILAKLLPDPYNPRLKGLWEAYRTLSSPCSVPRPQPSS